MDKSELPDEQLIESAKTDLSNFRALYTRYVKAVFRYAYHRLGKNRDLAEDITSETFVKAIEKFHTYEYNNKPFVVWLYTIAHNLIVDFYRSKKEKNISLDNMPINPAVVDDDTLEELSKDELKEKIDQKSKDLPDELNNIFTLKHTEDLTFREIANLLGRTEGAIKMQYYRGLEVLKGLIVAT